MSLFRSTQILSLTLVLGAAFPAAAYDCFKYERRLSEERGRYDDLSRGQRVMLEKLKSELASLQRTRQLVANYRAAKTAILQTGPEITQLTGTLNAQEAELARIRAKQAAGQPLGAQEKLKVMNLPGNINKTRNRIATVEQEKIAYEQRVRNINNELDGQAERIDLSDLDAQIQRKQGKIDMFEMPASHEVFFWEEIVRMCYDANR